MDGETKMSGSATILSYSPVGVVDCGTGCINGVLAPSILIRDRLSNELYCLSLAECRSLLGTTRRVVVYDRHGKAVGVGTRDRDRLRIDLDGDPFPLVVRVSDVLRLVGKVDPQFEGVAYRGVEIL